MAKRKPVLTRRKNVRKTAPATVQTAKIAPALISEKSKVIKKSPTKRRGRPAKVVRKKAATKKQSVPKKIQPSNLLQVLSSSTSSKISEPLTPEIIEIKIEQPHSPSVFANLSPSKFNQAFNCQPMPVPMSNIIANTTRSKRSSEMPVICSQTISSSINASQFGRIVNSQPISQPNTEWTDSQASQTLTDGDNYLNFMLSGSKVEPNKMVDCGIQCSIRAQCDAETSMPPIVVPANDFDFLDLLFLNKMADRLNIDRQTVIEASKDVLADVKQTYNLSPQQANEEMNAGIESIFSDGSFQNYEHTFEVEPGDDDSNVSSVANSIISVSTIFDYDV